MRWPQPPWPCSPHTALRDNTGLHVEVTHGMVRFLYHADVEDVAIRPRDPARSRSISASPGRWRAVEPHRLELALGDAGVHRAGTTPNERCYSGLMSL
jgi:hypothetical protein